MKRIFICLVLFLGTFVVMATTPMQTGDFYGGSMFFWNVSSYDLCVEFDFDQNPFQNGSVERLYIEKQDVILTYYQFFVPFSDSDKFDLESVYPNNYLKKIRLYNMNTGALLAEIDNSNKTLFTLKNGDVATGDAVIELIIDDTLFVGENI